MPKAKIFNMNSKKGKLILIPCAIEEENLHKYLPSEIIEAIIAINVFAVEELRTTRRFIKKLYKEKNIDSCTFFEVSEHSSRINYEKIIEELKNGHDVGLLSEAGCPGVADPGSELILLAHQYSIQVVPLVGPSSILLTLMASGLNGQQFTFNGYLPKDKVARKQKIKLLEKEATLSGTTQLFIETPYRNNHLFVDLLSELSGNTLLTLGIEVKSTKEKIQTLPISEWKKEKIDLDKKNVVFAIGKNL